MNLLCNVDGIVTADELAATVDAIAAVQQPDGNIPWTPGDHTDPWNLVEAAMALDVGGRHAEAERAYEWLRTRQRGLYPRNHAPHHAITHKESHAKAQRRKED